MTSSRQTSGNLLWGWLGLLFIPASIAVDSLIAISRGWEPRTAGAFGKVAYLALAIVPLSIVPLVLPGLRRFLREHAWQMWLFSLSVLFAAIVGEGVLRLMRPMHGFHLRPPGAVYEYDPDPYSMPGVFDPAKTTISSQGIRGPELPKENQAYKILCVGGSTTECYYLDDSEAWTALLMKDLNAADQHKYWVGSVGYSEYASGDHLRFLERSPLVSEVDCFLLLAGANDFIRLLHGFDMGAADPPLWIRSYLVDLVKEIWNVRLGQGYVVDRTGDILARRRLGANLPPREIDLDQATSEFQARIESFIRIAEQKGKRVVLVSQPTIWDDFLTPLGNRRLRLARVYPYPREWELLNASDCRRVLDSYNAALQRAAEGTGAGFVNPAAKMSGIEMYFYDDLHLNERGCREFARIVADWLQQHPPQATTAP